MTIAHRFRCPRHFQFYCAAKVASKVRHWLPPSSSFVIAAKPYINKQIARRSRSESNESIGVLRECLVWGHTRKSIRKKKPRPRVQRSRLPDHVALVVIRYTRTNSISLSRHSFVKKGSSGLLETKQSEPALARYGLNPVAPLQARRLTRTEVDRRGAVGVRFCGGRRVALAASARSVLESNPTYASRGEVVLMRNGSFNAHKHSLAMPLAAVPELTRNGGINLNGRVSLRRI
jgi:hypothetical protein